MLERRKCLPPARKRSSCVSGTLSPCRTACIQELDELVDRKLRRYPLGAIIMAMGTCLAGMLGALLDESQCTPDDIRELLREIESEIFPPDGPAKE